MTYADNALRWFLILLAVVWVTACGGARDDVPVAFISLLDGQQVVPATESAASARGLLTYEPETRMLTASVVTPGTMPTSVQLREGRPGINGPVVLTLSSESGTPVWSARAVLTDAQLSALQAENYYLEIQTATFPAGEARGQVFYQFPSRTQAQELEQYRQQSVTIDLQIQQLQRILDAGNNRMSWNIFIRLF